MKAVILIAIAAGLLFLVCLNIRDLIHEYWKSDD